MPGCACGSARLFWARRGVGRRGAEGSSAPGSGWRVCTGSRVARAAALALGALAPGGGGIGAAGAGLKRPLRGVAAWVPPLVSELPYPARRAPHRFLVVCAARERCGACLGVPAARRGSFGLGAASDGARRGRRTLRRSVGLCALAPGARAAPLALWALAAGGGMLGVACAGLQVSLAGRCGVGATFASELPYPSRHAPRRFLVVRAAPKRCGTSMCVAR